MLQFASASVATHSDARYDQPVWFQWGQAALEVYVFPPGHGQVWNGNGAFGGLKASEAHPISNDYLRATEAALADWERAVAAFAPAWLRNGFALEVYVVGRDDPPSWIYPEIVIVFDEWKATTLGLSVRGHPCLVDNSKFFVQSYTYNDMYSIAAHEIGHCLGLDHVAGDHPAGDVLVSIYAYSPGARTNPRLCPSNLNVAGLEGSFARSLGQASWLQGRTGSVATAEYAKLAC